MIADFFRRIFQILAISAVLATLYLNTIAVPPGHIVFLQSQVSEGGLDNRGFFAYDHGVSFVPTLFVPHRWRRYQLEVQPRVQEIKIKLPLKYSAYLRLNDLFYVQLRLKVEGEIQPNEAFAALKAMQFKPLERDRFVDEQFQFLAAEYFLDINTDEKNLERIKTQLTAFFANNNLAELQKRLDVQLRSPLYKLRSVELREVYVPDSQIYAAQTQNLGEVATADRRALIAQIEKEGDLAVERKRNLEDLAKAEKMSTLISENPDLVEYYKIEKIAPRAESVILDASAHGDRRAIHNEINQAKKALRGHDGKNDNKDGGEIGRVE